MATTALLAACMLVLLSALLPGVAIAPRRNGKRTGKPVVITVLDDMGAVLGRERLML